MLSWTRANCVAVLLVMFFAGETGNAEEWPALPVKFGLEALTPEELATLWDRADYYALAEAMLTNCGKASNMEKRMVDAVKNCVEASALQKVVDHYRERLSHYKVEQKHLLCGKGERQLQELSALIDKDISEAARECSTCVIC
jgi:hypothetical protein